MSIPEEQLIEICSANVMCGRNRKKLEYLVHKSQLGNKEKFGKIKELFYNHRNPTRIATKEEVWECTRKIECGTQKMQKIMLDRFIRYPGQYDEYTRGVEAIIDHRDLDDDEKMKKIVQSCVICI